MKVRNLLLGSLLVLTSVSSMAETQNELILNCLDESKPNIELYVVGLGTDREVHALQESIQAGTIQNIKYDYALIGRNEDGQMGSPRILKPKQFELRALDGFGNYKFTDKSNRKKLELVCGVDRISHAQPGFSVGN
ncbi:MAG: hypothetical protein AB7O96_01730 [Pseudobdellovibrionaceae bacterium]